MSVSISVVKGEQIVPYINDLARLRMTVFREYPYLYDGEIEYEMDYLKRFVENPNSIMVVAKNDNGQIVGASTACPMAHEMREVQDAFLGQGYNLSECYYFSESVLLPEYRGKGLGVLFFKAREEMAIAHGGIKYITFCAVDREQDHPAKPADYHSPESIWKKQGFVKHPELTTYFTWKEIGQPSKIEHKMTFWIKEI